MSWGYLDQKKMLFYVAIPFTKESWRGRIRASRGVGAMLSREKTEESDRELKMLLDDIGRDRLDIKHRITFLIFELKNRKENP